MGFRVHEEGSSGLTGSAFTGSFCVLMRLECARPACDGVVVAVDVDVDVVDDDDDDDDGDDDNEKSTMANAQQNLISSLE